MFEKELLPCSFCGDIPEMWPPFPVRSDEYIIECQNKNCIRPSTGMPWGDYHPYKDFIIKKWNKRSTITQQPQSDIKTSDVR